MGLKKIIFTAGSFDLFHFGHLQILHKAKKLGDILVVGVSTDKLIKNHKRLLPIIPYKERVVIIKELKCVDKVVKQTKLVDIRQFNRLKADLFIIGDDWKDRTDNKGINWLRDNNKIIFLPYTKHLSSSKIKEKIIRNAVDIIKAQVKK
jgi:glycerol-3-phosphate cytidylyltransferase